jgi:hypothetical protein
MRNEKEKEHHELKKAKRNGNLNRKIKPDHLSRQVFG